MQHCYLQTNVKYQRVIVKLWSCIKFRNEIQRFSRSSKIPLFRLAVFWPHERVLDN